MSNCFKHLRTFGIAHISYLICVFFEIFKKKKFNFVFKIIYLSTQFSYDGLGVRLDYDSINTIPLIFIIIKKKISKFPLCTLGYNHYI